MQADGRASPFNGVDSMERPMTGDSNGMSGRVSNTKLATAVYEDSQIVKALFVAFRTAVPHDVRLDLLHTSAEELKFLIAAQPRVSSFSHRRRHSLRHPALAMATKRFYFRRRERHAAYEQYMREQQQRQQEQIAASPIGGGDSLMSPMQDALDIDDIGSSRRLRPGSPSLELTNSMSLASRRSAGGGASTGTTVGPRSRGRKGPTKAQQSLPSPTSKRHARSASVSFADHSAGGGHDGLLSLSSGTGPGPSGAQLGARLTTDAAAAFGVSDGNDWCDFSMSVSNALWNYRRPSQSSTYRLHGGASDWGSSSALPVGGAHHRYSVTSAGSLHSFGVFSSSVPTMRALEEDRYRGMRRSSSFGALGYRAAAGLQLRSSVRSLLSGGTFVGPTSAPLMNASLTGDDDDDHFLPGASSSRGPGQRRGQSSLSGRGSVSRDRSPGGAVATGFDTAEEQEYRLFQELEDDRWDQLAFCYDLLLGTCKSLTRKASLAAAGDALVNDVIRRFWERITISPAADDVHRQERLKSSRDTEPSGAEHAANTNGSSAAAHGGAAAVPAAGGRSGATAKRGVKKPGSAPAPSATGARRQAGKKGSKTSAAATTSSTRSTPTPTATTSATTAAASTSRTKTESSEVAGVAVNADQAGGEAGVPCDDGEAALHTADGVSGGATAPQTTATTKKRKKKKGGAAVSNLPNVAAYMTPMQYIYLNMRIAQVLLPQRKELEVEMLESVQEDLLIDASYEPRAVTSHRTSSARLAAADAGEESSRGSSRDRSPSEDRSRSGAGANRVSYFGPPPQWLLSRGEPLLLSGRAFAKESGSAFADHQAQMARQQRRSRAGDDGADDTLSDSAFDEHGGDTSTPGGRGEVVAPWNPDRLPSIHYAQFWLSMLELADNWTCTGGNAVDTYIFLMELYAEVFGHDWDDEDEQLVKAMQAAGATARNSAKEAALVQNMEDALSSFHDLVKELDDLTSSSDSDDSRGHRRGDGDGSDENSDSETDVSDGEDDLFLSRRRKRHAKRRERRDQKKRGRDASDSDSEKDGDSPAGRRRRGGGGRHSTDDDEEGEDDDDETYAWRFVQRVGKDGRLRHFRRRVEYTKSRRRLQREADAAAHGLDPNELSEHDSDISVYMIEEELNRQQKVIRRRRARCHLAEGDLKRVRAKLRRKARLQADRDGDVFMYEPDGLNAMFRRRRFFDARPRKMRKLEHSRWAEDYDMDADLSEISSWSSFDDEEGRDEVHMAGGRRGRTRHRGPRREKRRHKRSAGFYYDRVDSGDDSDEDGDSLDDEDLLDNFSELSLSVLSDAAVGPKGQRGDAGSSQRPLTPEAREELRRKKKWLQETLAERGIHIADETFSDPQEEALLYELLQMTERLMRRTRAKNASETTKVGEEDEPDDIGIADFDAVLLAKLFAKPKQYTLDELQQSVLMEKLLRMGEELGADKMPLSSKQLDDVLAALLHPSGGRAAETTSMKKRRERLIQEARELREELKRTERARRREAREAERLREETEANKNTFDLTGVPGLEEGGATSATAARGDSAGSSSARRTHGDGDGDTQAAAKGDDDDDGRPFTGMTTSTLRTPSAPASQRPLSGGAGRGRRPGTGEHTDLSSSLSHDDDYDTYFQLHPLTAAQRKEQERLFREFEEFSTTEASEGGKYKVTFSAYTPEQFEAFYRHLHLGPQQRALLRGRAPLAPPTSVQGGTYHQLPTLNNNRNVGVRYAFSLGSAQTQKKYVWSGLGAGAAGDEGAGTMEVFKPAPVKLFTLTTKSTLDEAIEENFSSYLDDRAYKDSLLRTRAPRHPSRAAPPLGPSPRDLNQSGTVGEPSTPPRPSASTTLMPLSVGSSTGREGRRVAQPGESAADADAGRLPRIGIGFRLARQQPSTETPTPPRK